MISLYLDMTRGRPQEFDRETALGKAMDLFWSHGYEATGMQALTEHMGISRQSLYNTFGDKHSLLKEAIGNYNRHLCTKWSEILLSTGSPLKNMDRFFEVMESYTQTKDFRGCLMANTALEMGNRDPVVQKLLKKGGAQLDKLIEETLNKAVHNGELENSVDTSSMARFIINNIRGVMVTKKGGGTKVEIGDIFNSLRMYLKQFQAK
jgi:TetR/AcrR family transcriptional regulator, transcriptional repressor for nem operon